MNGLNDRLDGVLPLQGQQFVEPNLCVKQQISSARQTQSEIEKDRQQLQPLQQLLLQA